MAEFVPFFASQSIEKVGYDLKRSLTALAWNGIKVGGTCVDPLIAHTLLDPDQQHSIGFLSEAFLGYTLIESNPAADSGAEADGQMLMVGLASDEEIERDARRATEATDIALQLSEILLKRLPKKGQDRVFKEIECPLVPVLVEMERVGVALDVDALKEFSATLQEKIQTLESAIYDEAGSEI